MMFLGYENPPDLAVGECFCEGGVPTPIFDPHTSADVCIGCGVVLEAVLDSAPEYEYSENGRDVSFSSTFEGHTLNTYCMRGKDSLRASLMTSDEVKMFEATKVVKTICDSLRIPADHVIRSTAMDLIKRLTERVQINGKKRHASYAVAIYLACKLNNAERELRAFETASGIDIKNLNFALAKYREFNMNVSSTHESLASLSIYKLDMDDQTKKTLRKHVLDMIDQYPDVFSGSRKPRTIVGALILINAFRNGIDIDMQNISTAMEIGFTSISTAARDISKTFGIAF
jgi:transcription initiation factor TFIIIB Brf1 subunit/transcription initiation factor TFIIB